MGLRSHGCGAKPDRNIMTGPTISSPPRMVERWLRRRLSASGVGDFVIGDLREEFALERRQCSGLTARLWYCGQALRLALSRDARPLRRPPLRHPESPRLGPVEMLVSILQDIRYGFRSLLKSPVFALAAVLTIALGIGANAAIFSMVNAVLLRPLPYPEPAQLVRIYSAYPERDISRGTVSPHDFRDWRDQGKSFSQMTAFPVISMGGFVLTGNDRPERILAHYVEEGFFETLAVAPVLGRAITLADHAEGDNTVAVLSYSTWQARFGGESAIVGSRSVTRPTG